VNLREGAYRALHDAFTRGAFAPGDVVSLRGLADQLGISMTPVREAVRRLVAEGALIDTPSRTLIVPPFAARRMKDLKAARLALEHGVACNTAGGSHHAARDGGAGFCVFNDVAVAARLMQAEGLARRITVIDLDVHQGDGTARIFEDDTSVFTLSVHCEQNWPRRKAISDLDVGVERGTGDAAYLKIAREAVDDALEASRPDLVFFNAGVDPHAEDRLGLLDLSDAGLRAREAMVLDAVMKRGIPVVGVLGGGYSRDLDALARRHAFLHEAAAQAMTVWA
jgi:acetoin utilization deacetylase AcuC-like enzyme